MKLGFFKEWSAADYVVLAVAAVALGVITGYSKKALYNITHPLATATTSTAKLVAAPTVSDETMQTP